MQVEGMAIRFLMVLRGCEVVGGYSCGFGISAAPQERVQV